MNRREREVLEVLLGAHFPGVTELRAQLPVARVSSGPVTFLQLDVDRQSAPASPIPDGPIPIRAFIPDEHTYEGELLLWVEEGYLSALEFAWVTDAMPDELPPTDRIHVVPE